MSFVIDQNNIQSVIDQVKSWNKILNKSSSPYDGLWLPIDLFNYIAKEAGWSKKEIKSFLSNPS